MKLNFKERQLVFYIQKDEKTMKSASSFSQLEMTRLC